jgi:hypothetical protein
VHTIAEHCGVESSLGRDRTRCGIDEMGSNVFSDVFLADLCPDQRGAGVHLDVTVGTVVTGIGKSDGVHHNLEHSINESIVRKEKQYACCP